MRLRAVWVALLASACGSGGGGADAPEAPVPDANVDRVGPRVVFHTPAADASDVALMPGVVVVFDEAIATTSVTPTSLSLVDPGGTPVEVDASVTGSAVQLVPRSSLAPATRYQIRVTPLVTDLVGNAATETVWSFSTIVGPDVTPPQVIYVSPADDAVGVGLDAPVQVFFDEAVDPATLTPTALTLTRGTTVVPTTITTHGTAATLTPERLAADALFRATVTTAVTDLAGNALADDVQWSFRTVADGSPWGDPRLLEDFAQAVRVRSARAAGSGAVVVAFEVDDTPHEPTAWLALRSPAGAWAVRPSEPHPVATPDFVAAADGNGRIHVVWSRDPDGAGPAPIRPYTALLDPVTGWGPTIELDGIGTRARLHVARSGAAIVAYHAWTGSLVS